MALTEFITYHKNMVAEAVGTICILGIYDFPYNLAYLSASTLSLMLCPINFWIGIHWHIEYTN